MTVQDKGTVRYERTLGVVLVDSLNVKLERVRLGYAWHFFR
jgi:hypothetical protein